MKVIINNTCDVDLKHIRLIEEKINRLSQKFSRLLYTEVFIKSEGQSPEVYKVHVRLGVPGDDIIIKEQATSPSLIIKRIIERMHRYLNKQKEIIKR